MRPLLLDVREGRDHRLAIALQKLLAGPFLQIELAEQRSEQRSAVEYRLGQGRRDGVEGGERGRQCDAGTRELGSRPPVRSVAARAAPTAAGASPAVSRADTCCRRVR